MKIIKKDSDKLNSVISISLEQDDFAKKVLEVLKDYQKKANIPGFRKGHVPMGLVKKQYENAVTADEVNKLLQKELSNFIKEEKLEILGNPLPKLKEELNWKSPEITFEFEIGLAPDFDLNLKSKKKVNQYKIEADSKMIDEQVKYLQKQYGKLIRSKGFFWLATRPEYAGQWSQAGGIARYGFAGMFWKAVPKESWPDDTD